MNRLQQFILVCVASVCSLPGALSAQEKPEIDRFGDPLPLGAVARLGTARLRHHTAIQSLALSPDGKTIASAGGWGNYNPNEAIRLWDLATGKEIRQFVGHTGFPRQVVFSPDGRTLASVGEFGIAENENTVRLWDVVTGKQLHVFFGRPAPLFKKTAFDKTVAFSADGKLVASTDGGPTVCIWDVATGKERGRWAIPPTGNLVFSPNGQFLLSAGSTMCLWEPTSGKQLRTLNLASDKELAARFFTRDGRQLICTTSGKLDQRQVICFDWENSKPIRTIPGALMGWSPNARFLAVCGMTDIQIWDLMEGKEVHRFPRGDRLGSRSEFTGGLTDDGSTLITADFNTIRVLDTNTGKEASDFGHLHDVVFVAFNADDSRLVSVGDTGARTWEVAGAKEVNRLQGTKSLMRSAAMTKDMQTLATASHDGAIRLWDLAKNKERARLGVGPSRPLLAFSPDQRILAIKRNGSGKDDILLVDLATGKETRRFGLGNRGEALSFLPDGKLVELSIDIRVFDPDSGETLRAREEPYHNDATSLGITSDGRIAASGVRVEPKTNSVDPREVALWHMPTLTMIGRVKGHEAAIASLAFSPNCRILATGSWDGTVRLWDWLSSRELAKFTGHRGGIRSIAFSNNGRFLASGGSDTSIMIWDLASVAVHTKAPVVQIAPDDVPRLWSRLRARDALIASHAAAQLAAAPDQAVSCLKENLPRKQATKKEVMDAIAMLDGPAFGSREKSLRQLEEMLPEIEPLLQMALKGSLSLESRRRVKTLLEGPSVPEGELTELQRRELRAVHLLESLNTDHATQLLRCWTKQSPESFLGREARFALGRLSRSGN